MEIDGAGSCVEHLYDQPVYQLYQFAGGKIYIMYPVIRWQPFVGAADVYCCRSSFLENDMVSIVADCCNNRSVISCSSLLHEILAPPLFR